MFFVLRGGYWFGGGFCIVSFGVGNWVFWVLVLCGSGCWGVCFGSFFLCCLVMCTCYVFVFLVVLWSCSVVVCLGFCGVWVWFGFWYTNAYKDILLIFFVSFLCLVPCKIV
jgi:hypothetical protein